MIFTRTLEVQTTSYILFRRMCSRPCFSCTTYLIILTIIPVAKTVIIKLWIKSLLSSSFSSQLPKSWSSLSLAKCQSLKLNCVAFVMKLTGLEFGTLIPPNTINAVEIWLMMKPQRKSKWDKTLHKKWKYIYYLRETVKKVHLLPQRDSKTKPLIENESKKTSDWNWK